MAAIDDLIKQIQGQGTTAKWTGGYGADAATKDMARILSSIGITDINQFGPLTKEVQEYVGTEYEGGPPVYETRTVQTYGNKETGQEVPNTYTERQTGNAFGGTYEGKGNTGYRVDFTPDGKPVFYTTGASSSDVGQYMPMIQLALMATGAGGLLGNALLGTGASQVAAGALGGALLGGGASALTGQDILKGALLGGAGGALSGYLNPATGQISATPTAGSIPVSANDIASFGGDGSAFDLANAGIIGGSSGFTAAELAAIEAAQAGAASTGLVSSTLTEAELAQLDRSLGGAGGSTGAAELQAATATGAPTITNTALTGGSGVYTGAAGGITPESVAAKLAGDSAVGTAASTAAKGLGASDALRAASLIATIAGVGNAVGGGGGGTSGFPIVPIPSDWTSPIKPTGTAAFTPLAPIDFGNKEMLRGTQWEQLLSPDYGKAPAMPTPTNPSNMTFNELTKILGGPTTSAPAQNLSINDVIAGIQSQYGQTPQVPMG
jgi:hypothetical protein